MAGDGQNLATLRAMIPDALRVFEDALKGKKGKEKSDPEKRRMAEALLKKFGYLDREEGDKRSRFDGLTDKEILDRLHEMVSMKDKIDSFKSPDAVVQHETMESVHVGCGEGSVEDDGVSGDDGGSGTEDSEDVPVLPGEIHTGEALVEGGGEVAVDTGEARVAI